MARKKREMQSSFPHNRFYLVEWEINDLIKLNLISDAALRLWLIVKGMSWKLGMCDPTDEWLADWMGGSSEDTVRRSRHDLLELHLLLERWEESHRWLVPLPVTRGLETKLPESLVAETAEAVQSLREFIEREQAIGRREFTPHAGGVNEISPQAHVKQQQHASDTHEGESVDVVGVNGVGLVERGERGAGREGAKDGDVVAHPRQDALAEYLEGMGAFPPVADRLAKRLLARIDYDEARAYAQAHRLALTKTPPDGKPLERDELVRLWVSRLRFGTRASPALLAHGRLLSQLDADLDADPWEGAPESDGEDGDDAATEESGEGEVTDESAPPVAAGPVVECIIRGEMVTLTVGELWERALVALRGQMTRDTFDTCLRGTRAVDLTEDGRLAVEVASEQAAEMLSVRLGKVVARAMASLVGREIGVEYRVRGQSAVQSGHEPERDR